MPAKLPPGAITEECPKGFYAVEASTCSGCAFVHGDKKCRRTICGDLHRRDRKSVIFRPITRDTEQIQDQPAMTDQTTPTKPTMPTPRTVYITVGADPGATTTADGAVVESLIKAMELDETSGGVRKHIGGTLRTLLGLPCA